MKNEIQIIRYLLDEIEQRKNEIEKYKKEHERWDTKPPKALIVDNAKKIRQLALKIGKAGESL